MVLAGNKAKRLSSVNHTTTETIHHHYHHHHSSSAALPNTSAQFDTTAVVYTLMNPIEHKMIDFNKFVSNSDLKAFLDSNPALTCIFYLGVINMVLPHHHFLNGNKLSYQQFVK